MTLEIYSTEAEWLEARRSSIGGSEIIDILGLPIDGAEPRGQWWLWVQKNPAAWGSLSEEQRQRFREIEARFWKKLNGRARKLMEPAIEEWARESSGLYIVDPGDYAIVRKGRAHCSPDGIVASDEFTFRPDLFQLEALQATLGSSYAGEASYKTVAPFPAARAKWGDEPSDYALVQSQWTMGVMGTEEGWIFAQVGFGDDAERDRLTYRLERNPELIALLQEAAERFWSCVDSDIPPPVDGYLRTTEAIRAFYPRQAKREYIFLEPLEKPNGQGRTWEEIEADYRAADEAEKWATKEKALALQLLEQRGRSEGAGGVVIGESQFFEVSFERKPELCKGCGAEVRSGGPVTYYRRKDK